MAVPRPDPPSVGGVSREALTCAPPGPRKPARETIARIPAPPRSRRVSSSRRRARDRRTRPASTEKTLGCARAIPECDHQPDWVAVGAVSSEPVSHVDKRTQDEYENPGSVPRISCFRSFDRLGGVGETAGKCRRTGFHRSNVLHSPVGRSTRVGIPLVPGFKTFDRPQRRSRGLERPSPRPRKRPRRVIRSRGTTPMPWSPARASSVSRCSSMPARRLTSE